MTQRTSCKMVHQWHTPSALYSPIPGPQEKPKGGLETLPVAKVSSCAHLISIRATSKDLLTVTVPNIFFSP